MKELEIPKIFLQVVEHFKMLDFTDQTPCEVDSLLLINTIYSKILSISSIEPVIIHLSRYFDTYPDAMDTATPEIEADIVLLQNTDTSIEEKLKYLFPLLYITPMINSRNSMKIFKCFINIMDSVLVNPSDIPYTNIFEFVKNILAFCDYTDDLADEIAQYIFSLEKETPGSLLACLLIMNHILNEDEYSVKILQIVKKLLKGSNLEKAIGCILLKFYADFFEDDPSAIPDFAFNSVLNLFTEDDVNLFDYAVKAMKSLILSDAVISKSLFKKLINLIPSIQQTRIKKIFSIVKHFINAFYQEEDLVDDDDQNNNKNQIKPEIQILLDFIHKTIYDSSSSYFIKDACFYFLGLIIDTTDCLEFYEDDVEQANNLINENGISFGTIALLSGASKVHNRFVTNIVKSHIDEIINYIKSENTVDYQELESIFFLSLICSEKTYNDYLQRGFSCILSLYAKNSPKHQLFISESMKNVINYLDKDKLLFLSSIFKKIIYIIPYKKAYISMCDLMKAIVKTGKVNQSAFIPFIQESLNGNFKILGGYKPYMNPTLNITLFDFYEAYITTYQSDCQIIISHFIQWLPYLQIPMLIVVLKPLLAILKHCIISEEENIKEILTFLLKPMEFMNYNEHLEAIAIIAECLSIIVQKYMNSISDIDEVIQALPKFKNDEDEEEEDDIDDDESTCVIPYITKTIFLLILSSMVHEEDLDDIIECCLYTSFEQSPKNVINDLIMLGIGILKKSKLSFSNAELLCYRLLDVLFLSKRELDSIEVNENTTNEIVDALRIYFSKNPDAKNNIESFYINGAKINFNFLFN